MKRIAKIVLFILMIVAPIWVSAASRAQRVHFTVRPKAHGTMRSPAPAIDYYVQPQNRASMYFNFAHHIHTTEHYD